MSLNTLEWKKLVKFWVLNFLVTYFQKLLFSTFYELFVYLRKFSADWEQILIYMILLASFILWLYILTYGQLILMKLYNLFVRVYYHSYDEMCVCI